jgi:hypothetical protein
MSQQIAEVMAKQLKGGPEMRLLEYIKSSIRLFKEVGERL